MSAPILTLASTSPVRRLMLENAGVAVTCHAPLVDEDEIRLALLAEGAKPRDIADALAEAKARKVHGKYPQRMTLGCDQVLELDGEIFNKPTSPDEALAQLSRLSGKMHRLFSAAVVYDDGRPVWRAITEARLYMKTPSSDYLTDYVARNWPAIAGSVGGYLIEAEGIRLFHRIEGDHFTILGLPLIALLDWLAIRGLIAS